MLWHYLFLMNFLKWEFFFNLRGTFAFTELGGGDAKARSLGFFCIVILNLVCIYRIYVQYNVYTESYLYWFVV